jgi:hypothetical protein
MSERKDTIEAYMQEANRQSMAILKAIDEPSLGTLVYGEGDGLWSVRDVICHLADAEAGLLGQVRRLLAGKQTVPDDFDLNRWNRSAVRRKGDRSFPQLLDDIRQSFADALATLAGTDDADLDRVGRHPSGEMLTAEGYFRRMADHRRQHATDISRALESGSAAHP